RARIRPSELITFDEIEPASRPRHAGRRVAVADGRSRRRSGFAGYTRCAELDANVVDAGGRGVKGDGHRTGGCIIAWALGKGPMQVCTGRVVNVATGGKCEQRVEVAGGDRLVDHERVVAGWRRDLHPVEEDTWVHLPDRPVLDAVIHSIKRLGGASGEVP